MWKTIIILIAVLFLTIPSVITQAEEPNQGNEVSLRANRNEAKSGLKGNTGPNNNLIISDGVSAGFIFGLDSNRPENKHGLVPENKGYGLGLGFSFNF
ncbi:hypothetical protein [Maridesulfovibrio frigidus]|uniref:hypothetical protein n=1 Tax=Maridesulfovibrio frigidus TaxID=340956 RepID=UPI0004E0EEA4|nr:hypothetical protein [Maridesulfovibrio frigidus]